MEYSMILARFIGAFCIVVAAGILINLKHYQRVAEDYTRNSGLGYISGLYFLTFGLIIVALHNIWVADWRIIITLFGWLMLAKGFAMLALPKNYLHVIENYRKSDKAIAVHATIVLAIGITLTVIGLWA
jgi:uncharacterized membrane protein